MNLFSLNGKKALVTGGASGLGLAMVERLHEAGAAVGIIDVSRETEAVAARLSRSRSPAVGVRADPEWHRKVMDRVPIGRYGTPDDLRGTVIFWHRRRRITSAG